MVTVFSKSFAVILAGGSGTRFWPASRQRTPKQLCRILDPDRTMIELTLARLDGLIPPERRMIVTHASQADATAKIVKGQCGHILVEPEAKNTAAALALAALEIERLAKSQGISEPLMISLHADHAIGNVGLFQKNLAEALILAQQDYLTLLGVKPQYPETGYGYIEQGASLGISGVHDGFRVESFREKPNQDLAQSYLDSGRFFWNSGMFVWGVGFFISELERYLPQTVDALRRHGSAIELGAVYASLQSISVDHALLEKSKRVALLTTDFGWQDVGSWASLNLVLPSDDAGNLVVGSPGQVALLDTRGSTVQTDSLPVAVLGLQDIVVVVSGGAVLVCHKDKAQDVKRFVDVWKDRGRADLV